MSPGELRERIEARNRVLSAARVDNALALVEIGRTALGDMVQMLTYMRYLKEYLAIRHLDLNVPDGAEFKNATGLLENSPLVRRCMNLSEREVRYSDYELILHFSAFADCGLVRVLLEHYDAIIAASRTGVAFYTLGPTLRRLEAVPSRLRRTPVHPLPPLELPRDLLKDAAGNHRIHLSTGERRSTEQWLRQAGIGADDRLVLLVDDASTREKLLKPLSQLAILEYFLSMDGVRAIVYDVHEAGKQSVYRQLLRQSLFAKITFCAGRELRRNIALMGAANVKMILGPDTGLMHCAAGVYAARAAEDPNSVAEQPLIFTYMGKWFDFDPMDVWGHSIAHCIVACEGNFGRALRLLSECAAEPITRCRQLAPVHSISADTFIGFLETRFEDALRARGLHPP